MPIQDTTILIQGPLHPISISNIDIYRKYGEVIYSTWADRCTIENIDLIKKIYSYNIKFISLPSNILSRSIHNQQNIFYQAYSTYYGCSLSETKNIIKVRSDEKYTNLDLLINKLNNTNKIITSNIFFRKYNHYPYHISDHIIAGDKKNITEIFLGVVESCSNTDYLPLKLKKYIRNIPHIRRLTAEQLITLNALSVMLPNNIDNKKTFGSSIATLYDNKNFCIEKIKQYFDIIDVRDLGEFVVTYKDMNNKRQITSDFNFFANHNTDIITSMDEYI